MDAERALLLATRGVLAAFPDRIHPLLDAIERAFRRAGPRALAAPSSCAICGGAQGVLFHLGGEERDAYFLRPALAEPRFERFLGFGPGAPPLACLDCLLLADAELSHEPPSAANDRTLSDVVRALRASAGEEAEPAVGEVERAFARLALPVRASGVVCTACGAGGEGVRGPAGAALCRGCAGDYRQRVSTDRHTGAGTPAWLWWNLVLAVDRSRRLGAPLSLLLLDLDHFKTFNDIHGHLAGDTVLTRVPAIVRESLTRADDVLARVGGEEFAVILPGRGLREAVGVAESIRARALERLRPPEIPVDPVEATRRDAAGRPRFPDGRLTVSVGVSSLHPDADPGSLMRAAEERLLQAKSEGRNGVRG